MATELFSSISGLCKRLGFTAAQEDEAHASDVDLT